MNVARLSIERPLYPWLLALICLFGGWWGIETVGRLEDPPFPIKTAYVITPYPGASAEEVEQEVTDVIERALQQVPELDFMTSKSLPGRSEVQLQLLEHFGSEETRQIWDEMRRRISEARPQLPPGTLAPIVQDDFADVYGMVYAVTATDYSPADQQDVAKALQRELKSVTGVAKVRVDGLPQEAIYVELSEARLQRLGIPIEAVFNTIAADNKVVAAGSIAHGERRLRIARPPSLNSVAAVGALRVGVPGSTQIIRLADIANIVREEVEVPNEIIRHNNTRAFFVSVSVTLGENVVDVGTRVDEKLAQLKNSLPLGFVIEPVTRQHVLVANSVQQFMINLAISVATVIGALCLFMGWRAGMVVGAVLLLTVLGTLMAMALLGVELQRISLGALMIAMGMLVDNAIVVAEGMVTGVQRGQAPAQAAEDAVQRTQFPLLGATVIGILAFAPIGLSDSDTGHFLISLFMVVALSLGLSWILAVSLVPMLGNLLLRESTQATDELYGGWGYAPYRGLLGLSLRHTWLATLVIVAITGACIAGFSKVRQEFFPTTSSPLFFIDYFLPQGTDINVTADVIGQVADVLSDDQDITATTSFIGRGTVRFGATVRPEQPNPSYAHVIARVNDVQQMEDIMARVSPQVRAVHPDAELIVRRSEFSPGGASKMEARFSGPDANVLRELADATMAIYIDHSLIDLKTDWRSRELQLIPHYNDERGRIAGISREQLYRSMAFATEGVRIGLLRDGDDLLPIYARSPELERNDLRALQQRRIWSPAEQAYVPSSQVIDEVEMVGEDGLILRRNRLRTLTVQGNPAQGDNFAEKFAALHESVEAIPLPAGYSLEWGGQFEANAEARSSLGAVIPATFGAMFIVTMLLFGKVRQALVIWLTVPMTVCGVVLSLLATDLGFTFPAFLGFLSLTGMLIKNCVVLVDEIDKQVLEGTREGRGHNIERIITASVSRLRPVMLASGTTIAGMSPLLNDPFFREMAVCIMGGLAFSTLLTLLAVPVFYRLLIARSPKSAGKSSSLVASNLSTQR